MTSPGVLRPSKAAFPRHYSIHVAEIVPLFHSSHLLDVVFYSLAIFFIDRGAFATYARFSKLHKSSDGRVLPSLHRRNSLHYQGISFFSYSSSLIIFQVLCMYVVYWCSLRMDIRCTDVSHQPAAPVLIRVTNNSRSRKRVPLVSTLLLGTMWGNLQH